VVDHTVNVHISADGSAAGAGGSTGAAPRSGSDTNTSQLYPQHLSDFGFFGKDAAAIKSANKAADAAKAAQKGFQDALAASGVSAGIDAIYQILEFGFGPVIKLLGIILRIMGALFLPLSIALIKLLLPVIPILAGFLKTVFNNPLGSALGSALAGLAVIVLALLGAFTGITEALLIFTAALIIGSLLGA